MFIKNIFKNEWLTAFLILGSLFITIIPGAKHLFAMGGCPNYTLVTNIFVHSDVSRHWFNNMLYIALLGPVIEVYYGRLKTIIMIAITAASTSFCYFLMNMSCCGMSDICYMFIILHCFCKKKSVITFTCIFLMITQLGSELKAIIFAKDMVGHGAHFLGGMFGLLFGLINSKFEKVDDANNLKLE